MLKKIRLIPAAAIATLFLSAPLFADSLRLNVGIWPGTFKPELENRFFYDDAVPYPGQFDLGWTGKHTNTVWPLGVQYFKTLGSGSLVFGVNYTSYSPTLKYEGILIPSTSVKMVSLKDYYSNDLDAEAGYKFQIAGDRFSLTPKIGFRWHFTGYDNSSLTVGNTVGASVGDNKFSANARGTYAGLGFQLEVLKPVSIIGEYATTSIFPDFGGSMTYKTTEFFTGGGIDAIQITNQESDYQVKIDRWMLGVQLDMSQAAHLQFGLRQEVQTHSYPGFFGMNFIAAGGNVNMSEISVLEILSDKVFWEAEKQQKKGLAFFALSYDINL